MSINRRPVQQGFFFFLFVFISTVLLPVAAHSADVTLFWDPPAANIDGTPLSDLPGYKVYYGNGPGNYQNAIDAGAATTFKVVNLPDGTYYFAVAAYDAWGNESDYSNEVSLPLLAVPVQLVSTVTDPADGAIVMTASCAIKGKASGKDISKVEVGINGGSGFTWADAAGTASWDYAWETQADGLYSIKSRATDMAGNMEDPGGGIVVYVDKSSPASSINIPVKTTFKPGASLKITGTASDAGLGVKKVEVSTDGGYHWDSNVITDDSWATWSYAWTVPAATGSYKILSRATDKADRVETPGMGITIKVSSPANRGRTPRNNI